jgi:hypothetical protein
VAHVPETKPTTVSPARFAGVSLGGRCHRVCANACHGEPGRGYVPCLPAGSVTGLAVALAPGTRS